jgi:hypothetical protein
VDGGAGNLVERKMLQIGHRGSNGDNKAFAPIKVNTVSMDGRERKRERRRTMAIGVITALADRQYSELVEMLEERDDRLCNGAVEGEGELLDSTRKFASRRPVIERLLECVMIGK